MPEKTPQPTRRWKRTAAMILLLFAGGAVVNIAVAWGSVLWSSSQNDFEFEELNHAASALYWNQIAPHGWPVSQDLSGIRHWDAVGVSGGAVHEVTHSNMRAIGWQDHGLPMRAMRASFCMEGGVVVVQKRQVIAGRSFPTALVLPGFFVNTIFYATVLGLFFGFMIALRRVLRRKRRVCEKCAYPTGVSPVCTECGAAVTRKAEA